jgi:hypothetical protein
VVSRPAQCHYISVSLGLPQRAFAAFCAIAFRCSGVSVSARALPPLDAPSLLNVCAAFCAMDNLFFLMRSV